MPHSPPAPGNVQGAVPAGQPSGRRTGARCAVELPRHSRGESCPSPLHVLSSLLPLWLVIVKLGIASRRAAGAMVSLAQLL